MGLFPLYFQSLAAIPPTEVVAHRVVWSLVFMLALPAFAALALWSIQGTAVAPAADGPTLLWLVGVGPVTAIPLLLFAAGARRITMTTLGLLQYLGPTIQFGLGVWLFREPLTAQRLAGFALIWAALLVYSADGWRRSRAGTA